MYKYAQILNGKVHLIMEHEADISILYSEFFNEKDVQFVDITNLSPQPEVGWGYDGSNFTESPGPTLAELQSQAWSRIKAERDRREQSGAPYLGKILDSDEKSVTRISIAVQAAQAAISAGTEFSLDWTMQDNSVVTMTAAEVVGMSVALATHSNGLHLAARAVREKILAATDAAEVEAAEAAVVWPE